jgi:hypothetical protein
MRFILVERIGYLLFGVFCGTGNASCVRGLSSTLGDMKVRDIPTRAMLETVMNRLRLPLGVWLGVDRCEKVSPGENAS